MRYFFLWVNPAHRFIVKMQNDSAGVRVAALHPWGYWEYGAWIYSAITHGWTGPASDCTEWEHEEISEEQYHEALTMRGVQDV